ncbi:MAG: hypothetical protein Crog4KO_29800 [Crocinitomicaceae bacterium]
MKDGIVAFEARNFHEAIKILSVEMESPELLKSKDRASGWYYLGRAKQNLIMDAMSIQDREALEKYMGYDLEAYDHLQKALKEKQTDKIKAEITADIQSLSYVLFNSGNIQYLMGANEKALHYYSAAQEIAEEYGMKNDYQVYQYKGQSQLALGDSTNAYDNYKKAILHYHSQAPEIPDANIGYAFYSKAMIERYSLDDIDNALSSIQAGIALLDDELVRLKSALSSGASNGQLLAAQEEQFAQTKDALSRFELDIYKVSPDKYDEAVAKFEKAIQENPNDPNLYIVYADLIEYTDTDGAFEAYKKSIELAPNSSIAHFNAGANRVNKGVAFARKSNEATDFEEATKWQDKMEEQFQIALPYLKKGNELDPDNLYIIDALLQVTIQLEMMDEYNIYKEKRKVIRGY